MKPKEGLLSLSLAALFISEGNLPQSNGILVGELGSSDLSNSRMRKKHLSTMLLAVLVSSCVYGLPNEDLTIQNIDGPPKVSVCDITKDPAAFNKKQIEVTGFVSRGFEDSSLFDPTCAGRFGIWVEIGGESKTGVMYCCGETADRSRQKELVVEGIPLPLVKDNLFSKFDKQLERKPDSIVRASIRGTFFSGKKEKFPGGEYWVGYGHMGMNSLFVIQQIVAVDSHDREGLDYGASVDQPDLEKEGCGNYRILSDESAPSSILKQQKSDNGEQVFNDPKRVGSEGLNTFLKSKTKPNIVLTETKVMPGRISYHWRPHGKKGVRYMVVVNRPYWLSFYAKNPAKTIWVVSAAYRICE